MNQLKYWLIGSFIAAVAIVFLGLVLDFGALFYLGLALLCVWTVAAVGASGFTLPPRAMPIGLVGVLVAAAAAYLATGFVFTSLAASVAVGLAAGIATRAVVERRTRRQESRIDALPLWERDELGDLARTLRPAYRRDVDPTPTPTPHATAKIVAAVAKPLAGSTVIVSTNEARPVLAVYGSRVAVVYGPGAGAAHGAEGASASDGAHAATGVSAEEILGQVLPEGAKMRAFELAEGLEEAAPGRSSISLTEPHDLAAFLGGGAPANGDAVSGCAAHIHHKILVSLAHNGLYAGGM